MLVLPLLPAFAGGADATINEVEQELVTYPFSDPSPMAHIGRIYPYARFDGYTATGTDQRWTMVKLENDYLTVMVAPGIGGKVWSAYDRINHRDFLYHNPVVKFRDVGLRGPWTAGGLEFNFGVIGHAPTCATPVDYILRHDADGGVSCCIGALDLPSRTEWRVVIRLPRDQAAFATEASWRNPTDFHQSCYQWMTAAAEAADDLVVSHPGHHYLEHGGRAQTWPLDGAGHTLSNYRDNAFGDAKSYHVVGAQAEWFGGYFANRNAGYGHWSLFGDKPGQKVWLWSLSREGGIWRDLLTDPPAPQYIEMQSGLMHSQADDSSSATPFKHAALEPGAALQWSELWFPLSAIGGLAEASPWGAMNVTRAGGDLVVAICPLRALDAELRVTAAGQLIHRQRLTAQPLTAITLTLTIPLLQHDGILAVEVGDGLLSWHSDDAQRERLNRPLAVTAAPAPGSAEGLFTAGEEHLRQRDYVQALLSFTACLEVEPCHLRALTRAAELRLRRGEDAEALALARQALALDASDAGANFAYGTANAALGNVSDAMDGFAWAARSPGLRAQADDRLAGLCMRDQKWWRAAEYAQRGGEDATDGQECRFLAAVIARHRQMGAAAGVLLDGILVRDPLHHGARFERLLLSGGETERAAFLQPLRGESPDQTCLELALRYAALGDDDAALAVLALSPPRPLISYWQAYLRRGRDPAASDRDLERALAAPVRLVFPSRIEDIAMLRWASERRPHWKSSYYLGLLLLGLGRDSEARAELLACNDAPDEAAFYLNRSRIFTAAERARTVSDLERARSLDAADWRASHLLVAEHLEAGEDTAAVGIAAAALQAFPGNQAVTMDLAAAKLAAGRYREVIALLATATVLPFEGATDGRALYRRANLFAALAELKRGQPGAAEALIAEARTWPEHLGAGRPYDPDERLEDFLSARCRHALGDEQGARSCYQRIADWTALQHPGFGSMTLIAALALRELGLAGEAAALLSRWHAASPNDATYQPWAQAVFAGDREGARQALLDPLTGQPRPLRLLARRQGDFPLLVAVAASLAP